jgi:hypothetical protein
MPWFEASGSLGRGLKLCGIVILRGEQLFGFLEGLRAALGVADLAKIGSSRNRAVCQHQSSSTS